MITMWGLQPLILRWLPWNFCSRINTWLPWNFCSRINTWLPCQCTDFCSTFYDEYHGTFCSRINKWLLCGLIASHSTVIIRVPSAPESTRDYHADLQPLILQWLPWKLLLQSQLRLPCQCTASRSRVHSGFGITTPPDICDLPSSFFQTGTGGLWHRDKRMLRASPDWFTVWK